MGPIGDDGSFRLFEPLNVTNYYSPTKLLEFRQGENIWIKEDGSIIWI